MADSGASPGIIQKDGKLISPRIIDKVTGKLEHRTLAVHEILLHQTGSSTAEAVLGR